MLILSLLFSALSLAAPVSGLQNADTFLFGFTQTWSADYPMNAQDNVEVCMVATQMPGTLRERHSSATAGEDSPCAAIGLPGERFVTVKAYGPGEVRNAFFNASPNAPKQRAFEARLSGKEINHAYAELRKIASGKSYIYFLMVAHQNESWGLNLPLASNGGDNAIDPSNLMSDTRGGFTFSNFYAHHVTK